MLRWPGSSGAAGTIRERTDPAMVPVVLRAEQNVVIVALSLAGTGWQTSLF